MQKQPVIFFTGMQVIIVMYSLRIVSENRSCRKNPSQQIWSWTVILKISDICIRLGEYISENEWKTAEHLNRLLEETIQKMADVYSEGYRIGFVNTGGKDFLKKSVVNIRYILGFERVVKKAIENFEKWD